LTLQPHHSFDMTEDPMNHAVPSPLLTRALTIDAAATGTLAVVLIGVPHPLARLSGLPFEWLVASGAALAAWAAALAWMLGRETVARAGVAAVAIGHLLWAAGCAALAAWPGPVVTPLGRDSLLVQAAAACGLALAQALGLARCERSHRRARTLVFRNTL
jgi:hypothetical protein